MTKHKSNQDLQPIIKNTTNSEGKAQCRVEPIDTSKPRPNKFFEMGLDGFKKESKKFKKQTYVKPPVQKGVRKASRIKAICETCHTEKSVSAIELQDNSGYVCDKCIKLRGRNRA